MATATLIPVEDYLPSSWDPDREYVDRIIVERNWSDLPHSHLVLEVLSSEGSHVFTGAAVTSGGSVSITLEEIFAAMPEVERE